jgi:hypothetical protein
MVCAKYGSLRDSPVHRTFTKNRILSFGTICVHSPVIIVFCGSLPHESDYSVGVMIGKVTMKVVP